MNKRIEFLLERLQRLSVKPAELGIDLQLLSNDESGNVDEYLLEVLEDRIRCIDEQLRREPFLHPGVLIEGGILLGNTMDEHEVRVSIGRGGSSWDHAILIGAVGQGKSMLAASLAVQASSECNVVIVDSVNTFSKIKEFRERAEFLDIRDLRVNQFDCIQGLHSGEQDEVILKGLAQSYQMQLAEREMFEAVRELRESEDVDLVSLRDHLERKKYFGVTNRPRFRDTAVLHLSYLIDGSWPLFNCSKGMDLFSIVNRGLVVIRVNSLLPEHQAYLVRFLVDYLQLQSRSGKRMEKPLLLILDEGQLLLKSESNLAEKMLSLRHSRIHLCVCVQHSSIVPAEVLGNSQCIVCFSLLDERDRFHISKSLGLNQIQSNSLMNLERGVGICLLTRSEWKRPFLLRSKFMETDESFFEYRKPGFLERMKWSIRENEKRAEEGRVEGRELSKDEERLLRDLDFRGFSALS